MAEPMEGVARAALSSSRAIQVVGGPGTGKTQAIVQRAARLLAAGTRPDDVLVLAATRSAADALRARVAACGVAGADAVEVCTPAQLFEQVLSCPEARAFTGRTPRLLADFEERILMEDMKTCGLKTKRMREMLKFFFRQWTELGDEREGFLVEDDEHLVHDAIMRHLRLRGAMLPVELGNLTVKFLRDCPDVPAACRRAHVLADDVQDYSKATQLALDLIARESLMVCGNVNEQVETAEAYPCPEGFAVFAETHEGAEVVTLTQGVRSAPRIAAVGNGLAETGGMDERMLVAVGESGAAERVCADGEGIGADSQPGANMPAGAAGEGDAVRAAVKFQHPLQPFINVITHVMFYTKPDDPTATYRNTVVFLPDSLDRSPCGTGTSARVASLFAKGELGLNEAFVHESVIGTQFRARIVEPAMVGPYKGGIPEVSGSAYVTGLLKLVIDPADPLRHGFRLA